MSLRRLRIPSFIIQARQTTSGRLAQLVEHTPDKGEVAGSSPASPTTS